MRLPRRRFLRLAVSVAVLPAVPQKAVAQTYPSRPITLIVPFPAGGGYDVIARVIVERMRASLGQPIIIENVSGAGGSIGIGRAARARPDGYTFVLGGISSNVLNGALYLLSYDLLNDFAPISPLVMSPLILYSRKAMPTKDLYELIAWLKAHPSVATAAIEIASVHLATAYFEKETGTQVTLVPYRGAAPAMQDLVAGQVDLFFDTPVPLPLVRAGSVKALAVMSDKRLAVAPDIPTFSELGWPSLTMSGWYGLFAPKKTPSDVIGKLNAATVEALADPAARSRLVDLGFEFFPRGLQTPEALGALVKADTEKWWPLIKEFGIKTE
jgi:tripartite-type tricarboxylate transporter receptor subunit TctC